VRKPWEVNPETYAVCKSDLYMKSLDGKDADNIKFGSTLARAETGTQLESRTTCVPVSVLPFPSKLRPRFRPPVSVQAASPFPS